jgi:phosphoglycolate phosphatase-like HAD superfamily hydrolase
MTAAPKPMAVLFDVDETPWSIPADRGLADGSGVRQALRHPADIGEHSSVGETDPQVARATFQAVVGRDPSADELGKLYAQYLVHLADDIWKSEDYHMLPGADQTLVRLGEAGVMLGLVSGAMKGAASTKLIPANLNRFFVFGAYGSDSPDRAELTTLAIDQATRLHDQLTPAQVYVVGDTPHDMEATKAAGAVPIGVASGHYSADQLRAAGGAHVLVSLEKPFPGLPAAARPTSKRPRSKDPVLQPPAPQTPVRRR